jgi:hypothetical protein
LWQLHNLKPHLSRTFKLSRDAKFLEKLTDVVGLDLNYSITLITRNLLILHSAQRPKCPTIPLPLYVYCTANLRRRENRAEALSLSPASNSLTSAPPIGQGHRLRRSGSVSCLAVT